MTAPDKTAPDKTVPDKTVPRTGETERRSAFGLDEIWLQGGRLQRLGYGALARQLGHIAWRSILSAPLTSVLTVATMGTALFLLALFCFVLENLGQVAAETRSDVALTLYLKNDVTPEARQALEGDVRNAPEVAEVTYTSEAAALAEFGRSLGEDADLLEGLAERNPLPASFDVRFKAELASTELYAAFAERFTAHPAVERVHYSSGVVGRLGAVVRTIHVGGAVAIVCMLIATGFLMTNTIKLALYAHRSEIEIMRLVGATQWFVRAPFLIEGTVQGIVGACLGLAALWGVIAISGQLIVDPLFLSLVPATMTGYLSLGGVSLVLLAGVIVGFGGSFLAVRRFSIE